jgi:cobalt transporter subunit CbtA
VLRNILFSAFGAGLAVCVALSIVQAFTTEPLILYAETLENAAAPAHDRQATVTAASSEAAHGHGSEDWKPADGLERRFYSALANLVVGVAVSLMLLGAMVVRGEPIDWRRGLLWGAGGYVAVSLLPALGLPPELPGTPAAEILSRQAWWLAAAAASAAGIGLIVFGTQWAARIAGLALIVAPHVVGAPEPPGHDVAYPGALAGSFVVASLVVSAILWTLSGAAAGWLHERLSRTA